MEEYKYFSTEMKSKIQLEKLEDAEQISGGEVDNLEGDEFDPHILKNYIDLIRKGDYSKYGEICNIFRHYRFVDFPVIRTTVFPLTVFKNIICHELDGYDLLYAIESLSLMIPSSISCFDFLEAAEIQEFINISQCLEYPHVMHSILALSLILNASIYRNYNKFMQTSFFEWIYNCLEGDIPHPLIYASAIAFEASMKLSTEQIIQIVTPIGLRVMEKDNMRATYKVLMALSLAATNRSDLIIHSGLLSGVFDLSNSDCRAIALASLSVIASLIDNEKIEIILDLIELGIIPIIVHFLSIDGDEVQKIAGLLLSRLLAVEASRTADILTKELVDVLNSIVQNGTFESRVSTISFICDFLSSTKSEYWQLFLPNVIPAIIDCIPCVKDPRKFVLTLHRIVHAMPECIEELEDTEVIIHLNDLQEKNVPYSDVIEDILEQIEAVLRE